jgi:hypothetical protein
MWVVNEYIVAFNISMYDFITVQKSYSLHDLLDDKPCLKFRQSSPKLIQQLLQRAPIAVLEKEVEVVISLLSINELDYVGMFSTTLKILNLVHQIIQKIPPGYHLLRHLFAC